MKQSKISRRQVWLVLNCLLFILPLPFFWSSAFDNVFGICLTILILLSFPANFLVAWLFFAFGEFHKLPGAMFLLMLVCSAVAYLQWFVIVPRIAKYVQRKFAKRDFRINFSFRVENAKQLSEPSETATDFRRSWYDEKRRTPLERVFDNN